MVNHYDFMALHSEGLMCLSIEWKLYTSRISNREQLRKLGGHRRRTGVVGSIPAGGPYS